MVETTVPLATPLSFVAHEKDTPRGTTTREDITLNANKAQYFASGNKCGHNPQSYRIPSFQGHETRPYTIRIANDELRKASLSKEHFAKRFGYLRVTNKFCGRLKQTNRYSRSELEEAVIALSKYIWHNLEFSSMTVTEHDWYMTRPTFEHISRMTGLTESRIDEAFRKMKRGGRIKLYANIYTKENGEKRRKGTVIQVTPLFFSDLGIGDRYFREKSRKDKIMEQRAIKNGVYKKITNRLKRTPMDKENRVSRDRFNDKTKLIEEYLKCYPHRSAYICVLRKTPDSSLLADIEKFRNSA